MEKIRIKHTSDLHGSAQKQKFILGLAKDNWDIWLDTGDFCPDKFSVWDKEYQLDWIYRISDHIIEAMAGRPAVFLAGNHDHIDVGPWFNSPQLSKANTYIVHKGITISGFREIPFIKGDWVGEIEPELFSPLCDQMEALNPQILMTHVPPQGILDFAGGKNLGSQILYERLLVQKTLRPQLHLFGHINEGRGKIEEHEGIIFSNAATRTVGNMIEFHPRELNTIS